MCRIRKIKGNKTAPAFIIIFLLVTFIPVITMTSTHLVNGQSNQSNFNVTDSLNVQNIPTKKIHVGDIDIAYKTFGKVPLFYSLAVVVMLWMFGHHHCLKELATNNTVIIFDNRGVGNTTAGTRPFSIGQFEDDTVGLLDALDIQRTDVLGFSMASFIAQTAHAYASGKGQQACFIWCILWWKRGNTADARSYYDHI